MEHLSSYFDGDLEQMQKIMPNVVKNDPVTETENIIGSIYRQSYKEGEEIQEYDVEVLEYIQTPAHQKKKFGFVLAGLFDITATHELTKVDETHTLYRYTATNKALNKMAEKFLEGATDSVVVDFVNNVKQIAESEYKQI